MRHKTYLERHAFLGSTPRANRCALDADSSQAPELRPRPASYLRIVAPAILAHTLIAPALPRFLEQHREMNVQLLIAEKPGEVDQCDAAICIRPLASQPQWFARRLTVIPDVLCASEAFLTAHGTPRGPHELNPAQCIGVLEQDPDPSVWSFHRGSTGVTVEPAGPLLFSDVQSAVACAVRGGGLILVPELAVESQIAAGLLRPLLRDWHAPRRVVWMKHHGRRMPQLQIFADFVASLLPATSSEPRAYA